MKTRETSQMGLIILFLGLILLMISWNLSYPIEIPEDLNAKTFTQFQILIWPGIILSIIGLFLAGYYTNRKSIRIICVSLFPIILYSYALFFYYLPTSDSGAVKAMFEIFHQTGINPAAEPYFHYPVFFSLSEMTGQVLGFDAEGVGVLLFTIFGILIALYLFIFLSKINKQNSYQIAFLGAPLYFTALYSYLNYQWAPQTLALVFLVLLLFLFDQEKVQYKILTLFIFTTLVFTHLFIPAIFLLFLGFYSIKKKDFRNSFLLMTIIYISVLVYYTTFYFYTILDVFKQSFYGLGGEYLADISRSFMEPKDIISKIISIVNRIRIPLIWIILTTGFLLGLIKKKISFTAVILLITGGFYLFAGLFYPILGLRALQILVIPLLLGIGFFIFKWKKTALTLVVILLVLSVFGPLRETYDEYQFQLNEEEAACNFFINTMPRGELSKISIGGINQGYLTKKFHYLNMGKKDVELQYKLPYNVEFLSVFNTSQNIRTNYYILYNSLLSKEIVSYGVSPSNIKQKLLTSNRIYCSGKTWVGVYDS